MKIVLRAVGRIVVWATIVVIVIFITANECY